MVSVIYAERLRPPLWLFAIALLVIPATILVFYPINASIGWIIAIVLYLAIAVAMYALSPVVSVSEDEVRAGRARIPRSAIGDAEALDDEAASFAMHVGYDARAFHCTAPGVPGLVRVPVHDEGDPTTAWFIASRHPDRLVAALDAAGSNAAG